MINEEKRCGNCASCCKLADDDWVCEEYGFYYNGIAPVKCNPPYDEACKFWTDDKKKSNSFKKFI